MRSHRFARISILVLGILMTLAGLFILTQPVDANDFEGETGIAWSDFQASDPETAKYLVREARLLGVSFAVLGAVAVAIAARLLRAGNRTAWGIVWFVPVAFAGSAVVFLTSDAAMLGPFYAVATVVAGIVVGIGMRSASQ